MAAETSDYSRYIGQKGRRMQAAMPLERDTLRRFAQAIMDRDPLYYSDEFAAASAYKRLVAPPLYPVHAFRTAPDTPDPLNSIQDDPEADGTAGNDGVFFGLAPIESPYKRLLNGGNEIEFYRCLEIGETCVAQARYSNVELKQGKSGAMLMVEIETEFTTTTGDLLLINRQTLIWR
jgi:hypothetical protein